MKLKDYREIYYNDLTTNILPFWLEHGLDHVHGGVYTCVDREGNLMDSTKSVWFQGRCAFVYSYAYNAIKQDPEYLKMAKSCIDFIEQYCTMPNGRMYFEVAADGTPLRLRRYVFSECFAAIAFAEYAKATGDKEYAQKALETFKNIQSFLADPKMLPSKYMPSVHAIGHSVTMILINTAARIREVMPDACLDKQIDKSIYAITHLFLHPEYKALLETVRPDGTVIDTINGRTINPGHCIETAWFLLEEAKYRNWTPDLTNISTKIFDWSWDWGWDTQYGGIINFKDCRNFPPQDYSQDMKFWWPQCEAIIASLYCYLATGDKQYLDKHRQAHDWAYKHLPDKEFGEWYGYLHRDGSVAQPAKGNIFKGPFHIPRMMIKCIELIDEIIEKEKK